ncbi:MAG: PAS domain S-box protein [Deltaproteobacteria bacterium]|nr:PAS domain S-box protein [Deltaproteobacteria bacterium]
MHIVKLGGTAVMIDKIKSHLGLKLFMVLAAVIALSVAPLTYIAITAINNYGQQAAELNEVQIRSQASSYLREIVREHADKYQAVFGRIAASVGILGSQISGVYSNLASHSFSPIEEYQYHLSERNGFWMNSVHDPIVSLYWGGAELSPEIKNELSALSHMTPVFRQVLVENPEALASHLISVSGVGQYCTENMKAKDRAFNLPPLTEFDLRDGEPMTVFTASDDDSPGVRWTKIYKDDVIDGLMLTASAPIYNNKGIFCGATGIDVPLDNVIGDILSLGKSRWDDDMVLFSFLLDGGGRVIAIPEHYYPLFGISADISQLTHSADRPDVYLADSSKREVRDFAKNLRNSESYFTEFHEQAVAYLVATHRMEKSGWILGVVVRENDILSFVRESAASLKSTVKSIQRRSVFIGLLTVCIAIGIVFASVKLLVLPLKTLAGATRRVAGGDLTVRCPVSTKDEIGLLADSFNSMVSRLQDAQEKQNLYAEALEHQVEKRNIELGDKKNELEKTILQLDKEVERRQIVSEALKSSQQQYIDTLEASMAGVYIIENQTFTYVNSALADIFHTTREELIGENPDNFASDEDKPMLMEYTRLRLQGHKVKPYSIKWVRKDGTTFHGEVWGKIGVWQKKQIMVGTLTDISSIKLKEELLKIQDRRLQKSLNEKEVLLKEIYHRTKNNMLVIISLLDLQVQDIENEEVQRIFVEMQNRIRAMALVHEKLYQSQNLSEIELGSYLQEIIESLLATLVADDGVRFFSDFEPILMNIDYAIPLGLVVNEIVTNSVKHAFPGKRAGRINLSIKKTSTGNIVLTLGDDGVGLPGDFDVANSNSFGMGIVIVSLVKLQLKGTLTIDRVNGTTYRIIFPEPQNTKRI